jgi:hypothetical protein
LFCSPPHTCHSDRTKPTPLPFNFIPMKLSVWVAEESLFLAFYSFLSHPLQPRKILPPRIESV